MRPFYTYLYLRHKDGAFPAGTPYYVGKGRGNRAYQKYGHIAPPPADRNNIILFLMVSEDDAFESEKALIEMFGRKNLKTGCLANLTDGGEGVSGYKDKPERLEQKRKQMVGNKFTLGRITPDHERVKKSQATKGRAKPEGFGAKISAALTGKPKPYLVGKPRSEETKRKISDANKAWALANPQKVAAQLAFMNARRRAA